MNSPIPITTEERAWVSFYAVDADLGLVTASVLTTSQEVGLRVAAQLIDGIDVEMPNRILRRQKEVEIPLVPSAGGREEATRYRAAYTRTRPLRLGTGVGYETCILHRDATMQAALDHWGYLLQLPGGSQEHLNARFFHLWGQVTGLPARPAWAGSLWNAGLKLELIIPIETVGCEGWRIDPRWARPGGVGWEDVLQLLTQKEVV